MLQRKPQRNPGTQWLRAAFLTKEAQELWDTLHPNVKNLENKEHQELIAMYKEAKYIQNEDNRNLAQAYCYSFALSKANKPIDSTCTI